MKREEIRNLYRGQDVVWEAHEASVPLLTIRQIEWIFCPNGETIRHADELLGVHPFEDYHPYYPEPHLVSIWKVGREKTKDDAWEGNGFAAGKSLYPGPGV